MPQAQHQQRDQENQNDCAKRSHVDFRFPLLYFLYIARIDNRPGEGLPVLAGQLEASQIGQVTGERASFYSERGAA